MSTIIPAPDALIGKRFDVAVAKMMGISRAKATELIETGQARVIGRDIHKSATLQAGDTVEIDVREERREPEPVSNEMTIAYEDDDIVVVDKTGRCGGACLGRLDRANSAGFVDPARCAHHLDGGCGTAGHCLAA